MTARFDQPSYPHDPTNANELFLRGVAVVLISKFIVSQLPTEVLNDTTRIMAGAALDLVGYGLIRLFSCRNPDVDHFSPLVGIGSTEFLLEVGWRLLGLLR